MSTPAAAVAVLLFTRSAGEEAAHKRFVSQATPAANAAVAAQLIGHATATARQVGVDFLCIDSARQTGSSFGQRLAGAMQQAFEQGYEQLLVMGNDCPQLDAPRLRRAVAALIEYGAVLGPATDGGVYLLGVTRAHFDAAAWAALPWKTPNLGAALGQLLRQAGAAVALLPPLSDVDNEQDLARVLRQPLRRPLQRVLWHLRSSTHQLLLTVAAAAPLAFVAARPHRGPPTH